MRTSLSMHRSTAIAAGVLIILSQILNIASWSYLIPNQPVRATVELIVDTLTAALLAVILFRRKKDTAAGVVLLLVSVPSLVSMAWEFLSLWAAVAFPNEQAFYFAYSAMRMLTDFVVIGFMGLAAGECLSRGKVSAGGGKVLLWLLPVIGFTCALLTNMLIDIHSGESIGSAVWISAVYVLPKWIGPVLMGVSLFLPSKNTEPEL